MRVNTAPLFFCKRSWQGEKRSPSSDVRRSVVSVHSTVVRVTGKKRKTRTKSEKAENGKIKNYILPLIRENNVEGDSEIIRLDVGCSRSEGVRRCSERFVECVLRNSGFIILLWDGMLWIMYSLCACLKGWITPGDTNDSTQSEEDMPVSGWWHKPKLYTVKWHVFSKHI